MAIQRATVQPAFADLAPQLEIDPHHFGKSVGSVAWLLVLVLGLWAITFGNDFLPGDEASYVRNAAVWSSTGLKDVWINPAKLPDFTPIPSTFYYVEHYLWQGKLNFAHGLSVLLHAGITLMLWWLLRRLEIPGALLAATLFAVHPVQVDAVAWVSQQPLLWGSFFLLLSLFIHLRIVGLNPLPPTAHYLIRLPESNVALYILSTLFFVLGVLSSPIAAAFAPLVILLTWWERGSLSLRKDVLPVLPHLILSVIGIIAAIHVQRTYATVNQNELLPLGRIFSAAGYSAWFAFFKCVWPLNLMFANPAPASVAAWALILFWVLVPGALVAAWFLRPTLGRGPFAAVAAFLLLFLPLALADQRWTQYALVFDHAQYLAAGVVCAVVAAWLTPAFFSALARVSAALRKPLAVAAVLLLTTLLAIPTVRRALAYADTKSVWTRDTQIAPGSVLAFNSLGEFQLSKHVQDPRGHTPAEDLNAAFSAYQHALDIDRNDLTATLGIANVYILQGASQPSKAEQAVQLLNYTLHTRSEDLRVHYFLGLAYSAQGRFVEAVKELQGVVEKDPTNVKAFDALGLAYMLNNDNVQAESVLRRAMELNPHNSASYINLANLQARIGKAQDAVHTLFQAVEIDPSSYEALQNLGTLAATERQYNIAAGFFFAAHKKRPNNAQIADYLAMALLGAADEADDNGQKPTQKTREIYAGRAVEFLQLASRLEPENEQYRNQLANAHAAYEDVRREVGGSPAPKMQTTSPAK